MIVNFVPFPEQTVLGARSSPKKARASSLNDLQPQDGGLISAALSQQQQQREQPSAPPNDSSRLKMATVGLLEVFEACNGSFRFDRSLNPRRVLTKPARPVHNGGFDNEKHDYILYVNDVIGSEEGKRYHHRCSLRACPYTRVGM
jgi:dual specificity protein kinase YAK1